MVRLVAVDMDGTFLDDNKKKSPEFGKVLNALKDKGVTFCVASGRQMASIKGEFAGYEEGIVFISDNGTVIDVDGTTYCISMFEEDLSKQILNTLKGMPDKKTVYCGVEYSYIDSDDELSIRNAKLYLPKHAIVKDFFEIDEPPVKISVYSENGYDSDFKQLQDKFSDVATVCTSGFEWLDIVPKGSSKGVALKRVQEILGIPREECMAFGDQMNDFDMLNQVYYSYAMENAVDEIKQISRYTAPSNNEYGVITVLKEFFDIE